MAKAKPKHHETQALQRVEVIRGRTLRLMQSTLGNLRTLLSQTDNPGACDLLRGKSGDEILARCADFVMMEIGDTATATEGFLSRVMARKVRGRMGLGSEDQANEEADDAEAKTS